MGYSYSGAWLKRYYRLSIGRFDADWREGTEGNQDMWGRICTRQLSDTVHQGQVDIQVPETYKPV